MPDDRTADFAAIIFSYAPDQKLVESKIVKAVFIQLSQSWRFSRRLRKYYYERPDQADGTEIYRSLG